MKLYDNLYLYLRAMAILITYNLSVINYIVIYYHCDVF